MTLLQAIAHVEGYYAKGAGKNRPQRNFNPGDIRWGSFAKAHGATHGDPDMAVFPDEQTGFAALHALLSGDTYAHLTIEAAINRYAPPNENNTAGYVEQVCRNCGCKPTDTVAQVLANG